MIRDDHRKPLARYGATYGRASRAACSAEFGLWRRLQGAFRAGGGTAVAVSVSCAIKLLQRWRRTGSVAPDPRGRKPYALADHEGLVRELVAARPDMTLDELHEELGRRGIRVGRSSIGRFLLARAG